ncbi:hypothetical protein ACSQ67_006426 [Phaseolus vulgaris]
METTTDDRDLRRRIRQTHGFDYLLQCFEILVVSPQRVERFLPLLRHSILRRQNRSVVGTRWWCGGSATWCGFGAWVTVVVAARRGRGGGRAMSPLADPNQTATIQRASLLRVRVAAMAVVL